MKKALLPLFLVLVSFSLSGCAGVVGAGAAAVGVAAVKEGGLRGSLEDTKIQATINDLWFRHDIDIFRKLDLTVNQGRVLITGVVQDPEHRVDAVRLAWKAAGVKQVINEIKIAEGEGVTGFISDNWIVAQIRTGITLDKEVQNLNYTIDAVDGTVYLMGVAQSREEVNRVIERARTVRGVNRVVNYVKLAGKEISDNGALNPAPSYESDPLTPTAPPVQSTPVYNDPDPMMTQGTVQGAVASENQSRNSLDGPPGSPAAVRSEPLPLY